MRANPVSRAARRITHCDIPKTVQLLRQTLEVDDIETLAINWMLGMMPRQDPVGRSLHGQIAEVIGEPPDSVTRAGDLLGKKGKTVECTWWPHRSPWSTC